MPLSKKRMQCASCGETDTTMFYPSSLERSDYRCRACVREYMRQWRSGHSGVERLRRLALRVEVLTHYGNGRLACVRCGESRLACISIDHINGGGTGERRRKGYSTEGFYRRLKREGYPDGYQTLCMNDQWVKRYENNES